MPNTVRLHRVLTTKPEKVGLTWNSFLTNAFGIPTRNLAKLVEPDIHP